MAEHDDDDIDGRTVDYADAAEVPVTTRPCDFAFTHFLSPPTRICAAIFPLLNYFAIFYGILAICWFFC